MPVKTLETLFHDALTDIYSAERKILKSLPKMERATQAPASKAVFSTRENKNERLHKANLQEKSQAHLDLTAIAAPRVSAKPA